jgi:hypothetical protein
MQSDTAILLRLPLRLKQEIERAARQNDRTTVGEIRTALKAHVRFDAQRKEATHA